MNKYRTIIINYYDDVKNQIDIECEKIIADQTVSNEKKEFYNQIRSIFLSEIDKVQNFNLERLKTLKENLEFLNEENVISILLNEKFCFYLPRTEQKNDYNYIFKTNPLGKLIITNIYINEITRLNLRTINCRDSEIYYKMTSRDLVVYRVFSQLLCEDWCINDDLVDLTVKEKLKLKYLSVQSSCLHLCVEDDYKIIQKLMFKENVESVNINFLASIEIILRKMVSYFDFIEDLSIDFNGAIWFDDGLFFGFKKLKSLSINQIGVETMPKNFFNGLENLKELRITDSGLCEFEKNVFLNTPNLEKLDLEYNYFKKIKRSFFTGLEKLKILDLSNNEITHLPMNAFENLKNLAFLNMRFSLGANTDVKCFNVLKNLEFLCLLVHGKSTSKWLKIHELNLPKLKYLAIESNEIPIIKNTKLEFLHVKDLEIFDQNSLKMYPSLKGLTLEFDSSEFFDSINTEYFSNLENLAYLEISFYELTNEQVNSIDNKIESYKKILSKDECFSRKDVNQASHDYHFEVSNYENMENFFNQELNVSECVKNPITEYHKHDVTWYYP